MGYIKKKPGRDAIDWTMLEAVIKENPDLYGKLKYKSAGLMAVVERAAFSEGSAAGTSRPAAVARLLRHHGRRWDCSPRSGGRCLSIGLFAGIWELCWRSAGPIPKLLPPPHIFLGRLADQGKFFNTATRWQVGKSMDRRARRPSNR